MGGIGEGARWAVGGERMRWARASAVCVAVAFALMACGNLTGVLPPQPAPHVSLPAPFQWRTVGEAGKTRIAVPTTAQSPGPTVNIQATHEAGVGPPITGDGALDTAASMGGQVMAAEIGQLKAAGWEPLFTPTVTGSFPQYVLYTTLRDGPHYCFVEYSATELTPQQASQHLDIYHS